MTHTRVCLVAGARPNFMKVAPVHRALRARGRFETLLVHTGQHYDDAMSRSFFRDLDIPAPDVSLNVGSGLHGAQTARVLERFEGVLVAETPDIVVVVGDVNSTVACSLAATKMVYPDGRRPLVAHVEAGLRSFDRTMPEEINRILTDAMSDLLLTSEESGTLNLVREGIDPRKIVFVGNVMIDTLLGQRARAEQLEPWRAFELEPGAYGLITLHRPSNVDDPRVLAALVETLVQAAQRLPLVFPVHPRTRAALGAHGLDGAATHHIRTVPPMGYHQFLGLMSQAAVVLTDSGGVQEETTVLDVPCLTMRHNTERPVTTTLGTNRLVGTDRASILAGVDDALAGRCRRREIPPLWDGRAAWRIVDAVEAVVDGREALTSGAVSE